MKESPVLKSAAQPLAAATPDFRTASDFFDDASSPAEKARRALSKLKSRHLSARRLEQAEKTLSLARTLDAEILAHFYQRQEVKILADFVGGSVGLSRRIANSKARIILLCGVDFLAQLLQKIRPDLTVLIPRADAGCPFSQTVQAEEIVAYRRKRPKSLLVADVKASGPVRELCDFSLSSSAELDFLRQISATFSDEAKRDTIAPEDLIVLPALSMGDPDKVTHGSWPGAFCQVHRQVEAERLREVIEAHPSAKVAVNALCESSVRRMADFVGDSQAIHDWCLERPDEEFVIICEDGLTETLQERLPRARFVETNIEVFCPNMKLTNIKDLLFSLEAFQLGERSAPAEMPLAEAR
ncbi:MAG: quinolinate synthase NadA [Deltaproteobacteria bacterium]|jgi:quinolinate synthase|nr:quinolinate synthase NadA [Deltaproteobacteria bacterium]